MKVSAGILPFRVLSPTSIEVMLVHPGGPLWAKKDLGAWSIAKGELEPGETPEVAAVREFSEETGFSLTAPLMPLGTVTQRSGKVVHGFASLLQVDPAHLRPGTFEMEWPRGSGRQVRFPEVDQARWFVPEVAHHRILQAQGPFIDRLLNGLGLMG